MSEQIFRQKSLDRVKSPEGLNDYLKVSSPGVWIIIASAIILLIGATIWGIFGRIYTTVDADCVAENGTVTCIVSTAKIEVGMTVRVGDAESEISSVTSLDDGRLMCRFSAPIADGDYTAEIVTESIRPIEFILK